VVIRPAIFDLYVLALPVWPPQDLSRRRAVHGGVVSLVELFLITQQFSLRVPNLQAVPVDYVMIWTQGFGGFERQFEGLKCLHGMTAVSRNAKWIV
jgi:hypothetical protein